MFQSFPRNQGYILPKVEIRDYKVIVNRKTLLTKPIKVMQELKITLKKFPLANQITIQVVVDFIMYISKISII